MDIVHWSNKARFGDHGTIHAQRCEWKLFHLVNLFQVYSQMQGTKETPGQHINQLCATN